MKSVQPRLISVSEQIKKYTMQVCTWVALTYKTQLLLQFQRMAVVPVVVQFQ